MSLSHLTSITEPGLNIIANDFKDRKIINIVEEMSYDGYDRYGPKSNIWNLFVLSINNGEYFFSHYNWENWFVKNQAQKYDLISEYSLNNIITNKYYVSKIKQLIGSDESLKDILH
jgi:hypothetical protein